MNTKYIWLLALLLTITACSNDDSASVTASGDVPNLVTGDADFSNYVAVGNSLTAGYSDGALFLAAQQNSMPNLLSQQFNLLVQSNFNQPLMNDNTGGLLLGGNQILENRLVFNGKIPVRLEALVGTVSPTTNLTSPPTGPFNNMGVPGAKVFHLLAPGYGNIANLPNNANPYFVRMASSPNASVISDVVAQKPTFFTLWIGSNDVLGYATTGGDGSNPITPVQGAPGVGFNASYNAIVSALSATGAAGVIANIPDITSVPFFTTVPYNPLSPTDTLFGPQIPKLNAIFGALNGVYDFLKTPERKVVFATDAASAVVIHDESLTNLAPQIEAVLNNSPTFSTFIGQFGLPPQAAPMVAKLLANIYGQTRQANENDLLVLPSSSIIGTVNKDNVTALMAQNLPQTLATQFSAEGVTLPLKDKWVLLPSEQQEVKDATDSFNATIKIAAESNGYAFLDANALLKQLDNGGIASGNFILNSKLVTGGAFSLDGVHPTTRGYALIANELLKAIDATYNTNFEASGSLLDIGTYPTNYSPTLQ